MKIPMMKFIFYFIVSHRSIVLFFPSCRLFSSISFTKHILFFHLKEWFWLNLAHDLRVSLNGYVLQLALGLFYYKVRLLKIYSQKKHRRDKHSVIAQYNKIPLRNNSILFPTDFSEKLYLILSFVLR